MRLTRVFSDQSLTLNERVVLSESASHYLSRVLRLSLNAEIILFNGTGGEYRGRLIEINKKSVTVFLDQFDARDVESPLNIHLAQAIAHTDHWRYILQKSVELGVQTITPLLTHYSERARVTAQKYQHWQAILHSAAEQCGRTKIPTLNIATNFADFLKQTNLNLKIIADPRAEQSLRDLPIASQKQGVSVLIGAEGGFSAEEFSAAREVGYVGVTLGPRILRTETATVAVLAILQMQSGDW